MDIAGARQVTDQEGTGGTVVPGSPPRRSHAAQVVVQLDTGQQLMVPSDLFVRQPDGSYALAAPSGRVCARWQRGPGAPRRALVVPVVVEELEVQKRVVETGKVRITKVVHERETTVDEPLWHDTVAITRVPIQRVVEGPVPVREENGTTIISVVEEVLVVAKRWMLREEIHIRQQRIETHQPQRITLRSEDVQVERVPHADEDT